MNTFIATTQQAEPLPSPEVPSDPLALSFIILFAASELIGVSKLKSNSIVQLIQRLISNFKPARREDELVSRLRSDVLDLTESIEELRETVQAAKAPARKTAPK
jgi:hypothetical protein